ncbi:F-box/LRR-repeat protein 4-like protein [Drosera capensis]
MSPIPTQIPSINDSLRDDELILILSKLQSQEDKDIFGLVCKRWLNLQSTERKRLCVRAGPHMLQMVAARFTGVVELDLGQSMSRSYFPGVTDQDLAVIARGFVWLRALNLENCKGITDSGLAAIGGGLRFLQSLDVSACKKLTDKGLSAVAEGCNDLSRLRLSGCTLVTDKLLFALAKNCHNLESLSLFGCTKITDSGLEALVGGCRRIEYLDISKCSNVGDTGICCFIRACSSSLKALMLMDCFQVGDDSILSLATNCKYLEILVISGCRNVTDNSIIALANSCAESLRALTMDWCPNISDSSVNTILSKCGNLEAIDIGCCDEVTDAAFHGLSPGQGCEISLQILKASNCQKITLAGISMIVKFCKKLEFLDVRSCPHVTKAGCYEAGIHFPERSSLSLAAGKIAAGVSNSIVMGTSRS